MLPITMSMVLIAAPPPPAPILRPCDDPAARGVKPADVDALRVLLTGIVDAAKKSKLAKLNHTPGVGLLVAIDGEVVIQECVGNMYPACPCLLRDAAVPVVATAVLAQVGKGKLDLDDPISKHLPAFTKTEASAVTLRQLLSGRTSVTDTSESQYTFTSRMWTPAAGELGELADSVAGRPLTIKHYEGPVSGVDLYLAARMAEVAAGKPFDSMIRADVWEPIGMAGVKPLRISRTKDAALPPKNRAIRPADGYVTDDPTSGTTYSHDHDRDPPPMKNNGPAVDASAAVDFHGTLADLAAFYQLHLNGGRYGDRQVLPEEVAKAARTEVRKPLRMPSP